MIRDTQEYLKFWLKERDAVDIGSDSVQVVIVNTGDPFEDWLDCTFLYSGTKQGKPVTYWRTSTALTWSADNFPNTDYVAYARVVDSPETPLAYLGPVPITDH